MIAPIFAVCSSNAAVTALLGAGPVRLFPFGEAPLGTLLPYAVWQVINGSPENYLGNRPDLEGYRLQVDIYGATGSSANAVKSALEAAIENYAHVVSYNGDARDPATKNYRTSFDVLWLINR